MRRLVPLLGPILLLAGCPDSHSLPGSDGGASTDAPIAPGTDAPIAPGTDAPIAPGTDAPIVFPDAPSRCPLGAFDGFCTATGNAAVPAGTPVDLEVFLGSIDGCYCGEEIDCVGTLGPDGTLELSAAVCTDSICDACMLRETGVCHLPALAEGTYRVRVNGAPAFELTASNTIPFLPVDTCVTVPHTGCGPVWPPTPMAVDSACADTSRGGIGSPIPVEVVSGCRACGASPGPCVTTQTSPTSFVVTPQQIESSCEIACPAICMEVRHTCWLPALDAGTYTVDVEGIDAPLTVVVGDPSGGRTCVGLLTGGGP